MIKARVILLITVVGACLGAYFTGVKAGFVEAVAENNAAVAKVTKEALNEQARTQQVMQKRAYEFNKALSKEKISHERTKNIIKAKSVIQDCVSNGTGVNVAVLTSSTVGLLSRTRNSKALPEANNTNGVAGQKNTVTANDLALYSDYSIGEYNQCAIQLNALIDVVKGLSDSD